MKLISPADYAKKLTGNVYKIEQLRQFNIRIDRLIRTDRWINGNVTANP